MTIRDNAMNKQTRSPELLRMQLLGLLERENGIESHSEFTFNNIQSNGRPVPLELRLL